MLFPPFSDFINKEFWAKNWLSTQLNGHNYFPLQVENANLKLSVIAYQYRWYFQTKILYLSKIPFIQAKNPEAIDNQQIQELFLKLLQKALEIAKQQKVVFIKMDLQSDFLELCHWNEEDFRQKLQQIGLKLQISKEKIQYLATFAIDLSTLPRLEQSSKQQNDLITFFEESKNFWQNTSQKARRYTKKGLQETWQIDTEKSQANLETYWQIHIQTAKRQQFHTYSYRYYESIFWQPFSQIIILRDKDGIAHSVWLGIIDDNTLTYLYGGNTEYSLRKHGQYVLHLAAIELAWQMGLQYYDLGGYDAKEGYGQFKESYHGILRQFTGPFDIVLQPKRFFLIKKIVDFLKKSKNFHFKQSKNDDKIKVF